MVLCSAIGCANRSGQCSSVVGFHHFPLGNPDLLKRWVRVLRVKNPIITKNSRLCSEHFLPEDYKRDLCNELLGRRPVRRLKDDAVPSVFCLTRKRKMAPSTDRQTKRGRREMVDKNANETSSGALSQQVDKDYFHEKSDSVNVVKEEPCLEAIPSDGGRFVKMENPTSGEGLYFENKILKGKMQSLCLCTSHLITRSIILSFPGFLRQMSLMCVREMEKNELRAVTKFFHFKKLGAKEILTEIAAVLGNGAVSLGMVKNWIGEFQSDQERAGIQSRSELPSLSIIDNNHINQPESMIYTHW
uniref:THAP-type domain-containing protein n=1 Tax=Eptatretus burgeri TaxID=7764 RepID=A0A8C4N1R8_EPTBU